MRRHSRGGTSQPVRSALDRCGRRQHRFRRGAERRRDHRHAHRLRLDRGPSEALRLGRGDHRHIGQRQRRRNVVAVPDEPDSPACSAREYLRFKLGVVGFTALRIAGQDEDNVAAAGERRHGSRLDQHALPLPAGKPRDVQHNLLAAAKPPMGKQGIAAAPRRPPRAQSASDRCREGSQRSAPPACRSAAAISRAV